MTTSLGFLSIRQHSDHGYFGGYLVVNNLGRPLEFHCTLPVKPTRAQVLLYGPTMDDFVCGEQISKALITKAKINPDLIITDTAAVLSGAMICDTPIVCLVEHKEQTENAYLRFPAFTNLATRQFIVAGHKFLSLQESSKAESTVAEVIPKLSERFDITEPFVRIVEALFEAHPIIKAAA
jgi:hypothetical protein